MFLIFLLLYFVLHEYASNQYKLGYNDGKLHAKFNIMKVLEKCVISKKKYHDTILFSVKTTDILTHQDNQGKCTLKIIY